MTRTTLLITAMLVIAQPSCAAPCYTDGQAVTLSGTIHTKIITPGPDMPHELRYPLITFDQPLCLKSDSGNLLKGETTAAIVSTSPNMPEYPEGAHRQVMGQIGTSDTGNQPPEDLLLWIK